MLTDNSKDETGKATITAAASATPAYDEDVVFLQRQSSSRNIRIASNNENRSAASIGGGGKSRHRPTHPFALPPTP
jgi:hypothetical protein